MEQLTVSGGGQSATAAAALQLMGFRARYLGKFGEDELGALSKKSLVSIGVDTSACIVAKGCRNQTAMIWVERGTGERTIAYIRDNGLDAEPGDFSEQDIACGRVFMADAHCVPATIEAAIAARKAGIPVILDVERVLPSCEELLDLGDYLLCDGAFPAAFTGKHDPYEALAELADHFPRKLISTTFGPQGSLAFYQGQYLRTPGFVVDALDTTGAGDVFHAGFTAALLDGCDLFDCFEIANAAAALVCRGLGGRVSLGSMDEVRQFTKQGKRSPL